MKKQIIYLFIFFNYALIAQTNSNLDRINLLLQDVCKKVSSKLDNPIVLNFQSPANLSFLKNRTEVYFTELDKISSKSIKDTLSFNVEEAGISYSKIIKSGFFGDYYVERSAYIKGTYLAKVEKRTAFAEEFTLSIIDSVNYDDISKLENFSLPFTRGTLPPEPIAPSIIEPLIAISSAVLTVVLFFTVRSK